MGDGPGARAETAQGEPMFSGTYTPVRTPLLYRVGAAVVILVVVLQFLVYLGLIALACWGIWYWAGYGTFLLDIASEETRPGVGSTRTGMRAGIFMLILRGVAYIGPLIAGATIVIAMVGPLIPRRRERFPAVELDRREQRFVYAYVEQLAAMMGAPNPDRIELICEPNASAGREGGLRAALLGGRLVLRIGLTLAVGMRRSELTGVIAHELAHFAQGGAARAHILLSTVESWASEAVYGRGAVDEIVDDALEESWWPIMLVALLAKLCLWLARGVLWLFMILGIVCGAFLLRRMEYDADQAATRVIGSRNAIWGMSRIIELGEGWGDALERTQGMWSASGRRLPDNLPLLSMKMAPTGKRRKDGFIEGFEERTRWWSSHPAMQDRVDAIAQAGGKGILAGDARASSLFQGFETLCKITTSHFYLRNMGSAYQAAKLTPVAQVLGNRRGQQEPVPGEDAPIPLSE